MRKPNHIRLKASLAERQVDRLRLVILSVGILIAPWAWVGEDTNPRLALVLLGFGWAYALVLLLGVPRRPGLLRSHVTTAVDGLLSLGWIVATGGARSPAFGLLFIVAFAAAVRYPPRLTWMNSGLLAVGYLAMLALMGQLLPNLYASLIRVAVFLTSMYLGMQISRVTLRHAEERSALEQQRAAQQAREARLRLMEEQAARAAAEEALRVRDDFIAVAAHELKTPLTSLKLHIQALLRALSGEVRDVRGRLERVERQATRLDQLVENLLDVSRVARGRLDLAPQSMDLAEHVRESAERFAETAARGGSALLLTADAPVRGDWDPLRIDQLIDNLLSNAIKYGAGRPVELAVSEEHGVARLVVRDHGISIRPEDRARIFERFERAVSSSHFGGLGLGLWVVREVVNALGGQVTVQSSAGEGSTFIVSLPLHPDYAHAGDGHAALPTNELTGR